MILALVMALSLVACGDKQDDAADNNGDTATGSVYWLNFKPEADATLQKVAAMYTGRPVCRHRCDRRFRLLQRDPDRRDGQVRSPDAVRRGQPGRC